MTSKLEKLRTKERESVATLEKEREGLTLRVIRLEKERESAPVGKLASIATELGALAAALDIVDVRLEEARAAERQARAEADAEAVEALRPREREAAEAVVKATEALQVALGDLRAVEAEIISHRGWLQVRGPFRRLGDSVAEAVTFWGRHDLMHCAYEPDPDPPRREVKLPKKRQRKLVTYALPKEFQS